MRKRTLLQLLALIALYALLVALPFGLPLHWQDFMIFLFINILVVVSYRLMTLTGEFSLIHVVLQGCGAYTSALLAKEIGVSVWLSIPIGGAAAALIALALSYPLLRMTLFYFLIASFAAGEAIRLAWAYFTFPFGGPLGIRLIPSPHLTVPGVGTYDLWLPIPYYFLTLIVVSVCLWILYRLEHSRIGLTMSAVHWGPALAESVGVNTWRYRALAFAASAFFVGIAGGLLAHYLGTVNPDIFDVTAMIFVLIWVIVGGTTTFAGPIVGVTVLSVVNEWFRGYDEYHPLIYGCILLATMKFLPKGLESLPARLREWRNERRERPTGRSSDAGSIPAPADKYGSTLRQPK